MLGVFVVAVAVMWVIVHSPFGRALQAIRDNEIRAEFVGVQVRRYRWVAFLVSGVFTGPGRRAVGAAQRLDDARHPALDVLRARSSS